MGALTGQVRELGKTDLDIKNIIVELKSLVSYPHTELCEGAFKDPPNYRYPSGNGGRRRRERRLMRWGERNEHWTESTF